jgi:hypothetical protein
MVAVGVGSVFLLAWACEGDQMMGPNNSAPYFVGSLFFTLMNATMSPREVLDILNQLITSYQQ